MYIYLGDYDSMVVVFINASTETNTTYHLISSIPVPKI